MADRLFTVAAKYAGIGLCAIILPACGTTSSAPSATNKDYKAAIGAYANPASDAGLDPIAAAAFWGTRYNTDHSDPAVAVKFSNALRKIGSTDEAITVMQKTIASFADNPDVSLEYGKALIEDSRGFEAVRYIETAVAANPNDWRAVSAYGVAFDQIGEHKAARQQYDRALALAPGSISVLNNKGLSYAMDGNLKLAAVTLRRATSGAAASDARVRQNLALVLALKGDMSSAERLARSDLPPQVADNNIAYYRSLVNQPAYWGEYASTGVETPNFDTPPAAPKKSAPTPQPRPQLREEPKTEDKEDGAPIALIEATPVTNTSASTDETDGVELKGN